MQPHILRAVRLLFAIGLVLSAAASTANASTWHSNLGINGYSGTFTATSGPVTLTGSSPSAVSCTSATETGAVTGSSYGGNPWLGAITGSATFNGCLVGGQRVTKDCTYTTDLSFWGAVSYFLSGGKVSFGTMHLHCTISRLGLILCVITGDVPMDYGNPSSPDFDIGGYYHLPAVTRASGHLQAANGTVTCPLGTGNVGMSEIMFSETSSPEPTFWGTTL